MTGKKFRPVIVFLCLSLNVLAGWTCQAGLPRGNPDMLMHLIMVDATVRLIYKINIGEGGRCIHNPFSVSYLVLKLIYINMYLSIYDEALIK